jgi:serine/threonine protein phosphatase PrpC
LIDDICYSANLGDSRAIMSCKSGKNIKSMSIDHKPDDEEEKKRIIKNGGKVYK